MLGWCADAGAAAIPYGGGTSVVGGVEPRVGDDYARRGHASTSARFDRVLEVDEVSRAARIQAGVLGPALEEQLREHGLTLRHFPQSFEYSTLGGWIATRAGGHFATSTPTSTTWSSRCARSRRPGDWESRRLPGSGAGPSPDRMLIGSEGILGVITEAWVRVRPRPTAQALLRRRASTRFAARGRGGARALAVRASTRPTAACSTRPRPRRSGAGDGGQAILVLGFESAAPPGRRADGAALELARAHGGEPGEVAARAPAARRRHGEDRSAPGATPSSPRPTCATPSSPVGVLSDTFETAITWDRFADFHATVIDAGAPRRRRGHGRPRRGRGRAAVMLPLHPRLPRRPGALLHGPRAGPPRLRGRAVGRDQGRGLGGADRRRRHDHPPPRRRPRPPALVRPPAPRAPSPTPCAPPSARSTRAGSSTPAC